jgi:hypothetical protein
MRKSLVSIAVLALIGAGSAALAEDAIGTVKSVNEAENMVTLRDGTSYRFQRLNTSSPLDGLRNGDAVHIVWRPDGSGRTGLEINATSDLQAVGKIASMDAQNSTVTLNDGRVYHFAASQTLRSEMSAYGPGDTIRIAYHKEGGQLMGDSIGSTASQVANGVIRSVGANSVTLDDGRIYAFNGPHRALSTLKAGDRVQIIWAQSGDTRLGEAISPFEVEG